MFMSSTQYKSLSDDDDDDYLAITFHSQKVKGVKCTDVVNECHVNSTLGFR